MKSTQMTNKQVLFDFISVFLYRDIIVLRKYPCDFHVLNYIVSYQNNIMLYFVV